MAEAAPNLSKIGILSMGDMGAGLARYLVAKGFKVATNCKGRRYVAPFFLQYYYTIVPYHKTKMPRLVVPNGHSLPPLQMRKL